MWSDVTMKHSKFVVCCRVVLLGLVSLSLSQACFAIFINVSEPVPLDRLLKNMGDYVQQNPKEAKGYYTLGRIYSLAFATGKKELDVVMKDFRTQKALPLPGFAPYHTILVERRSKASELEAESLNHLVESLRNYRQATQLAPKEGLYWLGLGWMLEQGMSFASQVEAPFLEKPEKVSTDRWRDEAVSAYRRAYDLTLASDLKLQQIGPEADTSVSLEAGEGILRMWQGRAPTAEQRADAERIRSSLKTLQSKPRCVTPIIFPLNGAASLSELLAPKRVVTFDLCGDGRPERWWWVSPNAGILVWDPKRTERIASGRQLFGSVTWAMFWDDGYQPLAALDDDHDGWLTGQELEGIAVWCDRNGNGISDKGEVRPLTNIGIVRVAVQAIDRSSGVLCNLQGLQRNDGTFIPTYDWTPVSIPPKSRRARTK
jgi:hypothetical protein